MKKATVTHTLGLLLLTAPTLFGQGGFVASSLEQYNYQVGPNELVLKSYDGFDDISDFNNVDTYSLSINEGTPENIPFSTQYQAYKRPKHYDTLNEMLAERPINGSYEHTITYTSGNGEPDVVTITAPNVAYADGLPDHPMFTITGATGTWGRGPTGIGRFFFDPASVTGSFTVTMNAYNVTTSGGQYVYGVTVNDVTGPFTYVDDFNSDIVADSVTPSNVVLTFYKDAALNNEDGDNTTYGFSSTGGTRLEIEGEHVNIFGLGDAGLGDGTMKAFPYQSVTAFELVAVADPSTITPTPTSLEITDKAIGSQDGVTDRFFLDWVCSPADAAVDVYRSEDLSTWSKVSSYNQASTYNEPIGSATKAFYKVLTAGQTP